MPSILVATGFVRIDSDTAPALKSLKAFGALAGTALTTTIGPAAAAASTAILSIASAASVAGAAVTAYGVAVGQQFSAIKEASTQNKSATEAETKATLAKRDAQRLAKEMGVKYGQEIKITKDMTADARAKAEEYNRALHASETATRAAQKSQALYQEKLAAMPPATRQTALALETLKNRTQQWSDSLAGNTMPVFTRGIQFLTNLLPKLTPIVRNVAYQIDQFVTSLGEGQAGTVFRQFGANVQKFSGGALKGFLGILRNVAVGIVGVLNAFLPMSVGVTGGLEKMTARFATWGATLSGSKGFGAFTQLAQEAGPKLIEFLKVAADAFVKIASAAGPMSGVGLTLVTVFTKLIDAIPTPVLRLLVPAIIAVNTAMKLYAIYTSAASAATWLFTTSVTTSTGVVYASRAVLIVHRIALIATAAASYIAAAATTAFSLAMRIARGVMLAFRYALVAVRLAVVLTTTAFRLLSFALISSPIGLVILALVALGVAFYLLWKKSETFRNIVKGALGAVRDAAVAVGQWFAGPFVNFFKATWNIIYKVFIFPWVQFFTVWMPAAARLLWRGTVAAFNALATGAKAVWDFIYKWILAPWIRIFTQSIPGAARYLWRAVVGQFNALRDGLMAAYGFLRDRVFNPINTLFTKSIPGWARTMRNSVTGFFRDMRDSIGTLWAGIQDKTKGPVNWVIDHVWNRGIQDIWGRITGWIGIKNGLKDIKLLEAGGPIGNRPVGMFNKPTAIVGEGNSMYPEFVIPTDPKYRGRANALWQAAGYHLMEDGGILGTIGSALKKAGGSVLGTIKGATDFLTDPFGKAKSLLLGSLKGASALGNSPWVQMITRLPRIAVDGLLKAVKDNVGDLLGAVGLGDTPGSGVQRWAGVVQMALRMFGQPAALTNLTLRRMNQESGGNPNIVNRWDSNWKAGHPSVGLMQVIGPTFRSYAGRYRNTGPFLYGVSVNPLANVYASMAYALGRYGSLTSAYGRKGGYRNGTTSAAGGVHLFGEAGPELGFSPAGWRILNARRTAGLGGGLVIEKLVLENHSVIGSQAELENWLVDSLTKLKRKGRDI